MSLTPDSLDPVQSPAAPSPVDPGDVVADRWRVGEQLYANGDVHVHAATDPTARASDPVELRVAVFRYRGSEPLPRFLDALKYDAAAWGALRPPDGRMPLVVPTLDVGRIVNSTTCYWLQEAPRGPSLAQRLDTNPTLAPDYGCRIARRIGEALLQVHAAGLVHGALEPGNVHLLGSGEVRLAWGGLAARLEWAGMEGGRRSLAEVAPEVLSGRAGVDAPPDPRVDLYALAALLYRMIAGQPAWLVRRKGPLPGVTADDPLPGLPPWAEALQPILAVALQRDPALRPESVQDWLDRLVAAEDAFRETAPPIGTWAPDMPMTAEPTLPSVNRTISPLDPTLAGGTLDLVDAYDPVLSNAPPGLRATLPPGSRSVVPLAPRAVTPVGPPSLHSLPPPPRAEPVTERVAPPRPADRSEGAPRDRSPASPMGPTPPPVWWMPWVLVGGLLGVVVFFVVLFVAYTRFVQQQIAARPAPAPVAAAPAPEPAPVAAAPAPAPMEPAAVAPSVLTIESRPSGATVLDSHGRALGKTPLGVPFGTVDEPKVDRYYVVRLTGYRDYTVVQPWSESSLTRSVDLEPRTRKTVPPPGPPLRGER